MYPLISVLYEESKRIPLQARSIFDKKHQRHQRAKTRQMESRLNDVWNQFNSGSLTVQRLLNRVSLPHDIPFLSTNGNTTDIPSFTIKDVQDSISVCKQVVNESLANKLSICHVTCMRHSNL